MQVVIPAVGAAVGYYVGGPTGAQVGWMIGSSFTGSSQTIESPKLGETFVATSAYGAPLIKVYGTDRVPGNTFWATEKVAHTSTTSQGKGGSSNETVIESTYYTITRAVSIAWGPILGIRRVWDNDKLVVNPGQALPGILHLGNTTQVQDPVMQAHLGADIPAWRGRAYMVLEDEYLGPQGVVPNYSFEVVYGEVII